MFFSIFFSQNLFAQTINLYCSGVVSGQAIADMSYEFDLSVDTKTGQMKGMPGSMLLGCFPLKDEDISKTKAMECSVSPTSALCSCNNYSIIKSFNLSRSTLRLTTKTVYDLKEETFGRFSCKKVTLNAF